MNHKNLEVIFIFLGPKFEKYINFSLTLNSSLGGLPLRVIAESKALKGLKSASILQTPLEDFYDSNHFRAAQPAISSNASFRNGFWLKTLERFFVLEQFMKFQNIQAAFHAEFDQIVFRPEELANSLESTSKNGIFLPFHVDSRAVASILYCNQVDALTSFLSFCTRVHGYKNEMELLASWAKEHPGDCFRLPTITDFTSSREVEFGAPGITVSQIGGICDAAQLGQWIAGIDPRNIRLGGVPINKFSDDYEHGLVSRRTLEALQFHIDWSSKELKVLYERSGEANVYNLHLHSKVHKWIANRPSEFALLLDRLNHGNSFVIPGTRREQLRSQFVSRLRKSHSLIGTLPARISKIQSRLASNFNRWLGLRPSSNPFISGDSFRKLAALRWEGFPQWERLETPKRGVICFCEGDKLKAFTQFLKSRRVQGIVLVIGNSDANIRKEDLDPIFPHCDHVFAQNLIEPSERCFPIPIGLENLWRATHGEKLAFYRQRISRRTRSPRIMATFSMTTNADERQRAHRELLGSPTVDFFPRVTPSSHRRLLRQYAFVASPPGNGWDTHRTWEAIYSRCVPIVLRSYFSEFFFELGAPMWIVDSYGDIANLGETELSGQYADLEPRFDNDLIWFEFWKSQIFDAQRRSQKLAQVFQLPSSASGHAGASSGGLE